jgi:hypothetical protein
MFLSLIFLLQIFSPQNALNNQSKNSIKAISNLENHFFKSGLLAIAIKIPSVEKEIPYNDLPGSSDPHIKEQIIDLITTLGENGRIAIFLNHVDRLTKIGENLRPLHPLRFIGCIFSPENAGLKKHMRKIKKSSFKWNEFFTKELLISIQHECKKGNIFPYLVDFSTEVGKPVSDIKPFFERNDWDGLIEFLIEN